MMQDRDQIFKSRPRVIDDRTQTPQRERINLSTPPRPSSASFKTPQTSPQMLISSSNYVSLPTQDAAAIIILRKDVDGLLRIINNIMCKERDEYTAEIVRIQRWWRKCLRTPRKIITESAKLAATRIQAAWRGAIVRSKYVDKIKIRSLATAVEFQGRIIAEMKDQMNVLMDLLKKLQLKDSSLFGGIEDDVGRNKFFQDDPIPPADKI